MSILLKIVDLEIIIFMTNTRKRVKKLLDNIEIKDDFSGDICAGLKDDSAYEKMLTFLESNPKATTSDVVKKLSDIRGIPKWNAELGKFVPPEE